MTPAPSQCRMLPLLSLVSGFGRFQFKACLLRSGLCLGGIKCGVDGRWTVLTLGMGKDGMGWDDRQVLDCFPTEQAEELTFLTDDVLFVRSPHHDTPVCIVYLRGAKVEYIGPCRNVHL